MSDTQTQPRKAGMADARETVDLLELLDRQIRV